MNSRVSNFDVNSKVMGRGVGERVEIVLNEDKYDFLECEGVQHRDKRRVSSLIHNWKADIIRLQETKSEGKRRNIVKVI